MTGICIYTVSIGKPFKFVMTTNDYKNNESKEAADIISNGTLLKNSGIKMIKLTECKVGDTAGLVQFEGMKLVT